MFREMKMLIKACNQTPKQTEDYHLLTQREQVVIFRLRTGHNRLNRHMHREFGLHFPPCGEAEQSAQHVLQDCLNHQWLREDFWPQATTMQLYGTIKRSAEDSFVHSPLLAS